MGLEEGNHVPDRPHQAQHNRSSCGAEAGLHRRQGKAGPPQLFTESGEQKQEGQNRY